RAATRTWQHACSGLPLERSIAIWKEKPWEPKRRRKKAWLGDLARTAVQDRKTHRQQGLPASAEAGGGREQGITRRHHNTAAGGVLVKFFKRVFPLWLTTPTPSATSPELAISWCRGHPSSAEEGRPLNPPVSAPVAPTDLVLTSLSSKFPYAACAAFFGTAA